MLEELSDASSPGEDRGLVRPPAPATLAERVLALAETGRRLAASPGRAAATVAAVVATGLVGWALVRPPAAAVPVEALIPYASPAPAMPPGAAAERRAASVGPVGAPQVVVHAAGALHLPGVYRLDAGARVDDVVAAAGGLAPDADTDRLNLAASVSDGERVYVPRLGQEAPAVVGAGPSASSSGPAPPVALNTATVGELDGLPGIGPATAGAIVAFRDQHGPFGSVDELLDVRGIGPAKLDQLRPLVGL